MTLLGDFPVIRTRGAETERNGGFGDAVWSAAGDVTAAARQLAMDTGAPAIVIVAAHVKPSMQAGVIRIAPELATIDAAIGFPSRSLVTGLFLTSGAVLVPAKLLQTAESVPTPTFVLPHSVGRFAGNETPELAFGNGYTTTFGRVAQTVEKRQRLGLAASLGTEALNGYWWILGALAGLLPQALPVHEAWVRHENLLSAPNDLPRHLEGESRRVRLATDMPVWALSQSDSRTLKAMLPEWPPSDMWQDFVSACKDFSPDLDSVAERYTRAASHVWSEMA